MNPVQVSIFVFLGFEPQASWLRPDNGALPVLGRPWLIKSQHTAAKERNASFWLQQSCFRKVVHNPPSDLLTVHKKQQNSKDSGRPVHTLTRREVKPQKTTHSQTFFRKPEPAPHIPSSLQFSRHTPLLSVTTHGRREKGFHLLSQLTFQALDPPTFPKENLPARTHRKRRTQRL